MDDLVVVAGATGYAGRFLVRELVSRGHPVRAVVRSRARAEADGAHGAPALVGVAEWREGDVSDPAFVAGVTRGAHRVVSALGVTRQQADPWAIDYRANLGLLADAEREQVRSFLYVNVLHADQGESLILRSKAAFSQALQRSAVTHQVVNPSGYFSDVSEFLDMARRGLILVPPGHVRLAPIHGADLARYCVDRLDETGIWDVGGPDVLTYRGIAELAAAAVGRRCRIVTIPRTAVSAGVWCARRVGGRAETLAEFFAEGLGQDAIGERFGDHELGAYFRDLTAQG